MKKTISIPLLLSLLFLFTCCISEETKQNMQAWANLSIKDLDLYIREVELSSIRKEKMPSTDAYYVADFHCHFKRWAGNKAIVDLRGQIGFEKDGSLAKVISGSDKKPIILTSVVIDGDSIPVEKSGYNSANFLSSGAIVAPAQQNPDIEIKAKQRAAVSDLKSWGAIDAYVSDDNFLVYVADESSLSASPNEVARLWDEMFSDVPGIKGVRIVSDSSKKTIGEHIR